MLEIAIELGTYSVKFLNFQIEKKSVRFLNTEEVIIDHENGTDLFDNQLLWATQLNIVEDYLRSIEKDFQFFISFSSDLITHRFIDLPVKQRKKAALMLPFQIEEDLPYSLSDCHYSDSLKSQGETIRAEVGIIRKENFQDFFNLLRNHDLNPSVLTTPTSTYSSFVQDRKTQFPQAFAIIDFGHHTTKGYFFYEGQLVSSHLSYTAGNTVTEAISKSYSIPSEEATLYKHQNAFLLTEDQYGQVNENQKEFAKIMDRTLNPLISEIKRWEIGFRVTHGIPVQTIYICGGSSNIKNMKNYLGVKLNVKIQYFNPYEFINNEGIDFDEKFRRKFCPVAALALGVPKKARLINFLKGDYALKDNSDFPIESFAFISVRAAIFGLIFSLFMGIEVFMAMSEEGKINRILQKTLKNETLALGNRKQRLIKKTPSIGIKTLLKKEKQMKQEVRTIQASVKTNALSSLTNILGDISGMNVEIIRFESVDDGDFNLTLSSKDLNNLETINNSLSQNKEKEYFTELNKNKKTLTISGEE